MKTNFINENKIREILKQTRAPAKARIDGILGKARQKQGLELEEVGYLVNLKDRELIARLFDVAKSIKEEIYGERLVFFAPLYASDYCVNDCAYCNFHIRNSGFRRKKLTIDEVREQTQFLLGLGHKRLLLEFGEDSLNNPIDYVTEVIKTIYAENFKGSNIRRVNVNIAASDKQSYRKLKAAGIGTYQLFQETYHYQTYKELHCGPKADYQRQLLAHDSALEAGLDDLGLGVLFGLYYWGFEVLALVAHAKHLDEAYNVGPHTISVPRFCPAPSVSFQPAHPVSDADFLKLIAILRLAVPYTGMIISTREKPEIRKAAFKIGISQASACSVTGVGAYGNAKGQRQFTIYDQRDFPEIISAILEDKLIPSFCTACYRRGRTGEAFMDLAKPGEIKNFCRPNALLTFAEYLEDFAVDGLYQKGRKMIDFYAQRITDEKLRQQTIELLEKIRQGSRDLYF